MINIKFNNCVFFLLFCSIYLYLHSVTIADYHIDSSKYSQIVSYDERTNEEYIYYISNSEVTQAEWKRIIGINNSFFQNDSTSVENVSWIECIEFCNKLSLTENLIPYYNILNDSSNFEVVYNKNSNGYRLPFSNEWIFSLGEQLVNKDSLLWDQYSWNLSNSDYNPKKPKLLKNNKYNLYDMVGNVYEWCNDNFDTDLMNKLIIGGSWKDTKNLKLSDTIFKKNYNYSDNEIGLRLVRNVPSYGSLKILCNEPNINVEIYNNFNKIIVNDTLSDYNLICGNYNIIVYKDGFLKYFKNIEIKNSSLFLLKVVLKKGGTHNKNFVVVNRGNYDLNDQVVSINDLFVSKYETTQNEWKEIMNSNPSFFKGDSLPVENITFLEAIQFCNKKSKKNGFDECYKITEDKIFLDTTKNGYRLPTTIEWNYLVSGGKYQDHFIYSGSNNIEEVAWYIHNSNNSTHKVGKKIPNILGIYDMSGNVWEMCWDMSNDNLNNYYFSADKYDNYTSIKGGSWFIVQNIVI